MAFTPTLIVFIEYSSTCRANVVTGISFRHRRTIEPQKPRQLSVCGQILWRPKLSL
ncbi:MAG: hypothetical protein ACJA09_003210 [Alcanivorax sp.]|jgi:hypothetical protein